MVKSTPNASQFRAHRRVGKTVGHRKQNHAKRSWLTRDFEELVNEAMAGEPRGKMRPGGDRMWLWNLKKAVGIGLLQGVVDGRTHSLGSLVATLPKCANSNANNQIGKFLGNQGKNCLSLELIWNHEECYFPPMVSNAVRVLNWLNNRSANLHDVAVRLGLDNQKALEQRLVDLRGTEVTSSVPGNA